MATSSDYNLGTVLVAGGSGGLASQILHLFSQRGCANLHSIDPHQPRYHLDNVICHEADLIDTTALRLIFATIKPDVVIHTASPRFDAPRDIMYKVNVEGTKILLQIAKESGTRSLFQPEVYTHTKAFAEIEVLLQNRALDAPHFLTCAIRLSGIFGVGDLVVIPGILDAYYNGKTWVQLGSNENLFDFTENINVAHAHYLAAVALARQHDKQSQPESVGKIDSEAFFITKDEPRCFWDFTRLVWQYSGDTTCPEDVWTITQPWAPLLAWILE